MGPPETSFSRLSYNISSRCPCYPTKWRPQEARRKTQSSFFYNKCYIVFHGRIGDLQTSCPKTELPAQEAGGFWLQRLLQGQVWEQEEGKEEELGRG